MSTKLPNCRTEKTVCQQLHRLGLRSPFLTYLCYRDKFLGLHPMFFSFYAPHTKVLRPAYIDFLLRPPGGLHCEAKTGRRPQHLGFFPLPLHILSTSPELKNSLSPAYLDWLVTALAPYAAHVDAICPRGWTLHQTERALPLG